MTGLAILNPDGEVKGRVACGILGIDVAAVGFDEEVDILDGTAQDPVIEDIRRMRDAQGWTLSKLM